MTPEKLAVLGDLLRELMSEKHAALVLRTAAHPEATEFLLEGQIHDVVGDGDIICADCEWQFGGFISHDRDCRVINARIELNVCGGLQRVIDEAREDAVKINAWRSINLARRQR